ncbi:MAG: NUDIX domain-containing protein [Rickettsiales bacterium]|jgi:8-oxo-dGTP diphosphatase|nr:NUDIX domain-containing protein [Rickettsiales bacterium]
MNNITRIFTSLIIINKDNKVLMGLRKGSYDADTWGAPGGKLEAFEELKDSAIREVFEETGLQFQPNDLQLVNSAERINQKENYHYVGFIYITFADSVNPKIMEPEKCIEWKWFGKCDFPPDEKCSWLILQYKNEIFKYLK